MADGSVQPRAKNLQAALDGPLAKLLNTRALSPALATREMDGRLVPLAFVTALDDERKPVPGLGAELRDASGAVVDRIGALRAGFGILRFPKRKPRLDGTRGFVLADGDDVTGTVHLFDGSTELQRKPVRISPKMQADKVDFIVSTRFLPTFPAQLPPGDDPLSHLPTDFSEQACELLLGARTDGLLDPNSLTTRPDPLLSPPAGATTIVGKRLPLRRGLDVIRYGPDGTRYLVRLRQEWVLLTYTLGELADVKALDPGAVLQKAEQLATQVSSTVREAESTTRRTLSDTLQDSLSRLGTVDSVVRTVQNTSVGASASGWYIGIPGIVGYGSGGGSVNTNIDLTVTTSVNTSLLVNRMVQQVSTLVNEAVSRVYSAAEGAQHTAMDVVNNLAPLVQQVTNALHWRVYEVYAVCTNVDAVYEIEEVDLFAGALADLSADDILAYRPFFEPVLLDRTLADAFDDLRSAAELPPITQATIEVTYNGSSVFGLPVNLGVTLTTTGPAGTITASTAANVPAGNGRTRTFTLPFAAPRGSTVSITASVTGVLGLSSGTPVRAQVWIDRPVTGPGVVMQNPGTAPTWTFFVTVAAGPGGADVLVRHVNRNKNYYYGVLASAAIFFPSLRTDVTALSALDPRLWQLPLIGMEGTTALLVDPTASSVEIDTLLEDPGAGTLVQILAPGSYGEVLTGVLQLVGQLHPLMSQVGAASPFSAFPNLPTGPLP